MDPYIGFGKANSLWQGKLKENDSLKLQPK